jgi:hypothetical protein
MGDTSPRPSPHSTDERGEGGKTAERQLRPTRLRHPPRVCATCGQNVRFHPKSLETRVLGRATRLKPAKTGPAYHVTEAPYWNT